MFFRLFVFEHTAQPLTIHYFKTKIYFGFFSFCQWNLNHFFKFQMKLIVWMYWFCLPFTSSWKIHYLFCELMLSNFIRVFWDLYTDLLNIVKAIPSIFNLNLWFAFQHKFFSLILDPEIRFKHLKATHIRCLDRGSFGYTTTEILCFS